MSGGAFTYSLNAAAAFVLRSLMQRPDRQTPDEIADASQGDDAIDSEAARAGLDELESHGLAEKGADDRWRLTEKGRTAQAGS